MRFPSLFLLLALVAAGCGGPSLSYSVKATHDFDGQTDFSRFQTFQWVPLSKTIDTSELGTDVLTSLKLAFTDAFEAKGYRMTAGDGGDFLVALYAVRKGKILSTDWGYDYRWHKNTWEDYWMERRITTKKVQEGTLILDLLDARGKDLLWTGTATAVLLPDASGDKRNRRIDEAVEKLLDGLPSR